MELKKHNRIIPLLIGVILGWQGVRLITHAVYIGIILFLVVSHHVWFA